MRNRTRTGSSHQNSTSSGSTMPAAAATFAARPGKIVSRKEAVSASISMTSTKLALMIRMSCLNCDSRISTTTMMSDSDAATDGRRSSSEPEEVQKPPGEQEGQPGDEVVLGVQQDGERHEMQQHQHAKAQTMALAGREGQPGTTEKS